MRRSILSLGFAAGLLALGACSTLGQSANFDLAELTTRCESRSGTLTPTGAETGRAQADYVCKDSMARVPPHRDGARGDLNRAVDRSLRRGD